jgi:septum site-determining protein MinC
MMLPVSRLRLTAGGASSTVAQFAEWAAGLPEVMKAMPIVLDAAQVASCGSLMEVARAHGIRVLGVAEGPLAPTAAGSGLAVLPVDALMPSRAGGGRSAASDAASPAPTAAAARATRVITEPVRSGQQIYAEGSDLIVIGAVSPGAEVIADGCVHVYGALRGRAVAGARGDAGARIFCRRFEAELVACAGTYAVAEQMGGELRGKAVQVWLDDGSLRLAPLDM